MVVLATYGSVICSVSVNLLHIPYHCSFLQNRLQEQFSARARTCIFDFYSIEAVGHHENNNEQKQDDSVQRLP